jgi:hypothetical protein
MTCPKCGSSRVACSLGICTVYCVCQDCGYEWSYPCFADIAMLGLGLVPILFTVGVIAYEELARR